MRVVLLTAFLLAFGLGLVAAHSAASSHQWDAEAEGAGEGRHACIHDTLQREHMSKRPTEVSPQNYHPEARARVRNLRRLPRADRAEERESIRAAHPRAIGSLRFHLDTTAYFMDEFTCHVEGQNVSIGTPNQPCNETTGVTTDCVYTCENTAVVNTVVRNYVTDLIEAAAGRLSAGLDVNRVDGPLILDGAQECSVREPVPMDEHYFTTGEADTDIVLMITLRPTQGSLLAYAGPCKTDGDGRPLVAHVNIAPNKINAFRPEVDPFEVLVAIHEIIHGLGFTSGKFSEFEDGTMEIVPVTIGGPGEPYDVTGYTGAEALGWARDHFDCPALAAIPIEDGGGEGTADSHWEKRVLGNELMTGVTSAAPVLGEVTLLALEDSGWYFANLDAADPLVWGKNTGCAFVNEKCSEMPDAYICDLDEDQTCSPDRRVRQSCSSAILMYTNNIQPPGWRYFDDPKLGGSSQVSDLCPFPVPLGGGDCLLDATDDDDPLARAMYYGPISGCFNSALTLNTYAAPTSTGSRCFAWACDGDGMHILLARKWVLCTGDEDEPYTADFYNGELACPTADEIELMCVTPSLAGPAITGIEFDGPATLDGGQEVTITGTGFASREVQWVGVGGIPCATYNQTNTQVFCTTGAYTGNALSEDVTVVLVTEGNLFAESQETIEFIGNLLSAAPGALAPGLATLLLLCLVSVVLSTIA